MGGFRPKGENPEKDSQMKEEWRDIAKDLIANIGERTNLLYELTSCGHRGCILHLVEGRTYKQYVEGIFKRIEEIKSQLRMYADRDEWEWGGSPKETLESFVEELSTYIKQFSV